MNSDRKIAIVAGVLFIIGTAAGILNVVFTGPILGTPDYLVKISGNENRYIMGVLFQLIMGFACAGIAIALYPVLRKFNEGLALGAAGFRLIEGVFHLVGVIILLLLLTLSREFVKALTPGPSYFQTLGVLLTEGRNWAANAAGIPAWCIGAFMYYWIFYRTKLIPQWLSVWGLAGIILALTASILPMFNLITTMSTAQFVLNFPIALQEMVLAVWLIVKGFNPSVIASGIAE
jgi:hypothetical protein